MKRLSFFFVVIVLLAGVPTLAASSQSEYLIGPNLNVAFLVENINDPWPGSPYTAEDFLEAGILLANSLEQMTKFEGEICAYVFPAQVFDSLSWTTIAELIGRGVSVLRFEPGNPKLTGIIHNKFGPAGDGRMSDDRGEWKPLSELVRMIGCAEDPSTPMRGNGDSPRIISGTTNHVGDGVISWSLNANVELDGAEVVTPDVLPVQCEVDNTNRHTVDCTGELQFEELANISAFLLMLTDSGRLFAFDLRDAYYLIQD